MILFVHFCHYLHKTMFAHLKNIHDRTSGICKQRTVIHNSTMNSLFLIVSLHYDHHTVHRYNLKVSPATHSVPSKLSCCVFGPLFALIVPNFRQKFAPIYAHI